MAGVYARSAVSEPRLIVETEPPALTKPGIYYVGKKNPARLASLCDAACGVDVWVGVLWYALSDWAIYWSADYCFGDFAAFLDDVDAG